MSSPTTPPNDADAAAQAAVAAATDRATRHIANAKDLADQGGKTLAALSPSTPDAKQPAAVPIASTATAAAVADALASSAPNATVAAAATASTTAPTATAPAAGAVAPIAAATVTPATAPAPAADSVASTGPAQTQPATAPVSSATSSSATTATAALATPQTGSASAASADAVAPATQAGSDPWTDIFDDAAASASAASAGAAAAVTTGAATGAAAATTGTAAGAAAATSGAASSASTDATAAANTATASGNNKDGGDKDDDDGDVLWEDPEEEVVLDCRAVAEADAAEARRELLRVKEELSATQKQLSELQEVKSRYEDEHMFVVDKRLLRRFENGVFVPVSKLLLETHSGIALDVWNQQERVEAMRYAWKRQLATQTLRPSTLLPALSTILPPELDKPAPPTKPDGSGTAPKSAENSSAKSTADGTSAKNLTVAAAAALKTPADLNSAGASPQGGGANNNAAATAAPAATTDAKAGGPQIKAGMCTDGQCVGDGSSWGGWRVSESELTAAADAGSADATSMAEMLRNVEVFAHSERNPFQKTAVKVKPQMSASVTILLSSPLAFLDKKFKELLQLTIIDPSNKLLESPLQSAFERVRKLYAAELKKTETLSAAIAEARNSSDLGVRVEKEKEQMLQTGATLAQNDQLCTLIEDPKHAEQFLDGETGDLARARSKSRDELKQEAQLADLAFHSYKCDVQNLNWLVSQSHAAIDAECERVLAKRAALKQQSDQMSALYRARTDKEPWSFGAERLTLRSYLDHLTGQDELEILSQRLTEARRIVCENQRAKLAKLECYGTQIRQRQELRLLVEKVIDTGLDGVETELRARLTALAEDKTKLEADFRDLFATRYDLVYTLDQKLRTRAQNIEAELKELKEKLQRAEDGNEVQRAKAIVEEQTRRFEDKQSTASELEAAAADLKAMDGNERADRLFRAAGVDHPREVAAAKAKALVASRRANASASTTAPNSDLKGLETGVVGVGELADLGLAAARLRGLGVDANALAHHLQGGRILDAMRVLLAAAGPDGQASEAALTGPVQPMLALPAPAPAPPLSTPTALRLTGSSAFRLTAAKSGTVTSASAAAAPGAASPDPAASPALEILTAAAAHDPASPEVRQALTASPSDWTHVTHPTTPTANHNPDVNHRSAPSDSH
jgi:hypothetical protein